VNGSDNLGIGGKGFVRGRTHMVNGNDNVGVGGKHHAIGRNNRAGETLPL
jgi:hypothetical protein